MRRASRPLVRFLCLALAVAAGAAQAVRSAPATLPLHLVAGDPQEGFRDGAGASAQFRKPIRLAAFDESSILVADINNHAIRRVTRDGAVTTIAGRPEAGYRDGPAQQALFDSPHGVAVSATGLIAVGEANNNTIRLITPVNAGEGKPPRYGVSTLAGTPGVSGMKDGPADKAQFSAPHAVAWQADGSLLVLDIGNARVRRIADGVVTTVVANGDKQFSAPIDFTVASDRSVYIADAGNGHILRWSASDGLRTLKAAGTLNQPHGIAVGADGLVFAAEIGGHQVTTLDSSGVVTRVAGTGKAGSGVQELNRPAALLIHAGLLWIADLGNNRIQAADYGK